MYALVSRFMYRKKNRVFVNYYIHDWINQQGFVNVCWTNKVSLPPRVNNNYIARFSDSKQLTHHGTNTSVFLFSLQEYLKSIHVSLDKYQPFLVHALLVIDSHWCLPMNHFLLESFTSMSSTRDCIRFPRRNSLHKANPANRTTRIGIKLLNSVPKNGIVVIWPKTVERAISL